MASQDYRPIDVEAQEEYKGKLSPKIFYAGDKPTGDESTGIGQPYVVVAEDYVAIVASSGKVLSVNPNYGLSLSGPMALAASPDQVTFAGGYLKINPTVMSTLPSTSATPIPWVIKGTPPLLEGSDDLSSSTSFAESS